MRVGVGYDAHRFNANRRLVLGGVEIPHHLGLEGHSDADVVLHALVDAILGAAGCGDIGQHFPPSDEQWRDADSLALLSASLSIIGSGWRVGNADVVVIAEQPKIGGYRDAMRDRIAETLNIDPGAINVKATTNEGMGFVGRGEGIAALATVFLERDDS